MVEKVKAWCEYELKNVTKYRTSPAFTLFVSNATTRCYGIVMFVSNSLLGYDTPEGKELATWWDDEMLPRFREVM